MKKTKFIAAIGGLGIAVLSVFLIAADHIDAPAVAGTSSDITDLYAFRGENTNNLVFVANVQGLLSPANTPEATFDENVLLEFNIDRDGDLVEDLVIQAIKRGDSMYFFGPTAPSETGLTGTINTSASRYQVKISNTTDAPEITTEDGLSFYAGPREDPFYFDFTAYNAIIDGNATMFDNPGTDTFAGTNVLSVVVEVPKSMLGSGSLENPLAPNTPVYGVWVTSNRKQ